MKSPEMSVSEENKLPTSSLQSWKSPSQLIYQCAPEAFQDLPPERRISFGSWSDQSDLTPSDAEYTETLDICQFCGGEFSWIRGQAVCCDCGAQLGPEIQNSNDLYCYEFEESQCNNLHNPLLTQFNYTTGIAGGKSQLQRLNLWSQMPYREKALAREFRHYDQICHGLPANVSHQAQLLYKEILEQFRQTSDAVKRPVGLDSACLYVACRENGLNRTYQEIADLCGTSCARVIRGHKIYQQIKNAGKLALSGSTSSIPCLENEDASSNSDLDSLSEKSAHTDIHQTYLRRFGDALALNATQQTIVDKLLHGVLALKMLNEPPISIVAGVLYTANLLFSFHLPKHLIANQTGVSEITVVKIHRKILPYVADFDL